MLKVILWHQLCQCKLITDNHYIFQLVRLLRSFGIKGQLDPVVSLCLGPCEVSVEEMVDAYTTFPNKGIRVEPLYVTRIEDNNGNVLGTFSPKTHEVLNEQTAYKMI